MPLMAAIFLGMIPHHHAGVATTSAGVATTSAGGSYHERWGRLPRALVIGWTMHAINCGKPYDGGGVDY